MCLVQDLSLYNLYFHVYAFIILTLTRTYIKTTACGHQFFIIAAGGAKHIHEFYLTRNPWMSKTYNPYYTGIPLHVMLISEKESFKATFEQQTRYIVQETINELNEINVCGYLQKSECVLEEIKAANEYFLSKLQNLLGTSNSNLDEEAVIEIFF